MAGRPKRTRAAAHEADPADAPPFEDLHLEDSEGSDSEPESDVEPGDELEGDNSRAESDGSESSELEDSEASDDADSDAARDAPRRRAASTSSAPGPSTVEPSSASKAPPPGTTTPQTQQDHEDSSSESEDEAMRERRKVRTTIGNVPLEWYDDLPHIGYDLDGRPVAKPVGMSARDAIDEYIRRAEDPNYFRTVRDDQTGEEIVLTNEEMEVLRRIQRGEYADGHNEEEFVPALSEVEKFPISSAPLPKSRFTPSKWDQKKIMKILRAMRNGWIKPKAKKDDEDPLAQLNFDVWESETDIAELGRRDRIRALQHVPAPKAKLPGHAASYNPPEEYLFTPEEEQQWREADPLDRKLDFIPQKFQSLRHVPAYSRFVNERFERCLDLYLCPRVRKDRIQVDPESLIPTLPKPEELKPFPSVDTMIYRGHTGRVNAISVHASGEWLASGSVDGDVRVWEVSSGRCVDRVRVGEPIASLHWNPNPRLFLLAVGCGSEIVLVCPRVAADDERAATRAVCSVESPESQDENIAVWEAGDGGNVMRRVRVREEVKRVQWHAKGDYLVSLAPLANTRAVVLHRLSAGRSQAPFRRVKGRLQDVAFHPTKAFLFIATMHHVRVYNLTRQVLHKRLQTGCKWVSRIAVHPQGDNVLVGSYDRRVCWFDMDLSMRPYKVLRHHEYATRSVCYHPSLPLFATCSDDAAVHVFHGRVFNDLMENPLIVPLKKITGRHGVRDHLGVLDIAFHPTQPWLFSAGADGDVRLFADA